MKNRASSHLLLILVILGIEIMGYMAVHRGGLLRGYETSVIGAVRDLLMFIPVMMAPQLGFTFGSQQTTPPAILSDHLAGVFYPQGYLRPGLTLANATALATARRIASGLTARS